MFSLIISVIAIGLFGLIVLAGINHLPADLGSKLQTSTQAATGFSQLATAFFAYRDAHGSAPASADWAATLTPTYGFYPTPPAGLAWSYGTDGSGGYWFCLSGTLTSAQYRGLSVLAEQYSTQAYFRAPACGATANGAEPTNFPAAYAATYWVTAP